MPWISIKPWLHATGPDAIVSMRSLLPAPGLTYGAWLSGSQMTDTDGVLQQFWDGFRLPDYFGWNFPALSDCLRDLTWLSAEQYSLVIEEAHEILPDDPDGFRQLLDILSTAGAKWSYVKGSGTDERARFQVVLACSQEGLERVRTAAATL
ncbi:barstar family protein [Streptomyces lasiicapitis]|uniref:barstar family protein n=1 Tax=Streptomyces lasiicapitis TaxID=1923961 RepID=UPI00367B6934